MIFQERRLFADRVTKSMLLESPTRMVYSPKALSQGEAVLNSPHDQVLCRAGIVDPDVDHALVQNETPCSIGPECVQPPSSLRERACLW